jgi:hypothetical protein
MLTAGRTTDDIRGSTCRRGKTASRAPYRPVTRLPGANPVLPRCLGAMPARKPWMWGLEICTVSVNKSVDNRFIHQREQRKVQTQFIHRLKNCTAAVRQNCTTQWRNATRGNGATSDSRFKLCVRQALARKCGPRAADDCRHVARAKSGGRESRMRWLRR